jgi:SAM-dependent methyltransferase
MDTLAWEERYRSRARSREDFAAEPLALVAQTAQHRKAGRALDLACGTGRNAIWLAQQGWEVTAVDGAPSALESLSRRAAECGVRVNTLIADLEKGQLCIEPESWDLICCCYYLQRDLFESAKRGLAPGGVIIVVVHLAEGEEPATNHRLLAGQLAEYFSDLEILHSFEGRPNDPFHRRAVAEIVARKRHRPEVQLR